MTTDASRKAVLDTNELLEQIILYLPMKNIFGIQRACRQFKDVIATSPKIQEKMFLRLRNNDVPDEEWSFETHGGLRSTHRNDRRFRKVDPGCGFYKPVVLNPILELIHLDPQLRSARDRFCSEKFKHETVKMSFSQAHFGSQPSFLKTYITDPPCRRAEAEIAASYLFDPKGDPKEDSVRGTVSGDLITLQQGLTIGDAVFARGYVGMGWEAGQSGLGGAFISEAQLEEVMHETAALVLMRDVPSPTLTLQLWGVVVPTDEEWSAVSSEHTEDTS